MTPTASLPAAPTQESTASILGRIALGDARALGTFHERYVGLVRSTVRRRASQALRRYMPLEDIVQEVWLLLASRLPAFRYEHEAALRSWLRTVIEHRIRGLIDEMYAQIRDVGRTVSADGDVAPLVLAVRDHRSKRPDEANILSEESARLMQQVEALPREHQDLLHLRYWDGLTWETIRRRLNRPSLGAASEMHRRALGKLRSMQPAAAVA